jgi:hypothetical protein
MKLTEVFNQLTTGELSQLSIGGAEAGQIAETDYVKVVNHINLGLTALYKRFYLKEGRVDLNMVSGRSVYPIHSRYAVSNTKSKEPVKYLLDSSVEKFQDDILKIESVLTDAGFEIPLNDATDVMSITTTSPTILRIPAALINQGADLPDEYKTSKLTVVFRANHPIIDTSSFVFDPETIELELPESHLEPLLLYVASRATMPTGMVNEFNAGNNYASKFELSCQQLEAYNFHIDRNTTNQKLLRNGWV